MALNLAIQQCRYFNRPLEYRNKSYNADTVFQEWLSERRILTFTHMSRRSYEFIYNLIRSDARFVNPSATSPARQRSVFFQLFVALTRLTGDGDAGCVRRVCELFNIGTGTVGNYTRRCVAAINAHADTYIFWPNSRRRAELSAYADSKYGFPGFIGSCDGTVIGLRRAPSFAQFPETYRHPRHGVYGYNVLFWADHFGAARQRAARERPERHVDRHQLVTCLGVRALRIGQRGLRPQPQTRCCCWATVHCFWPAQKTQTKPRRLHLVVMLLLPACSCCCFFLRMLQNKF